MINMLSTCWRSILLTTTWYVWYTDEHVATLLTEYTIILPGRHPHINVKRYLINYPHLFDYGQTIFCLSFPSRDRATAPGRYEQFYFTEHVPYPQKIHFEDAIRSEDPVQLFCNSFCVQHKMVGDDYPSILQCLVYCHSAN